jgi:hypothetical protein
MERPMVSDKQRRAEDAAAKLRFNVTGVVSEEVSVDRDVGLIQVLRLRGAIPDDIGYSGLAGKGVTATLSGDGDFPVNREVDQKHGVTEGLSIGEIGLDGRRGLYVHANVHVSAVQAIATVAHRALGSGVALWIEARYASSSIKQAGKSRPNDLRRSTEKRAALLDLSIVTWAVADDD